MLKWQSLIVVVAAKMHFDLGALEDVGFRKHGELNALYFTRPDVLDVGLLCELNAVLWLLRHLRSEICYLKRRGGVNILDVVEPTEANSRVSGLRWLNGGMVGERERDGGGREEEI